MPGVGRLFMANQMKRRLLLSLAGGILIPLVLGVSSVFLMDVVYAQWGITWLDWVAWGFLLLVGWPLILVGPFLPASDSLDPNAPAIRSALFIVGLLLDIFAYSLLTYLILRYRSGRGRLA
jgi:hypothetical protein